MKGDLWKVKEAEDLANITGYMAGFFHFLRNKNIIFEEITQYNEGLIRVRIHKSSGCMNLDRFHNDNEREFNLALKILQIHKKKEKLKVKDLL